MSWAVDCRTHGLDTHANRPWQRRPGLQAPAIRWQPEELLLVSGCSGHADRSRSDVDAAASCSNRSDCMSLSAYRHLLRALCWLASAYRHLLRALCWLACGAQDRRAEIEQDEANVGLL